MADDGLPRGPFLKTYGGHIRVVPDGTDAIRDVLTASSPAETCPEQVKLLCSRSVACEAIFQDELLKMSTKIFTQQVRSRVRDFGAFEFRGIGCERLLQFYRYSKY